MKKQYVVFGAGRFGRSVALTLQGLGGDVIVVDKDEDLIQDIADSVSYAMCADITEPDTFKGLGLTDVDAVVISMASSLEASVVTAMLCSEAGIPRIIAKARNDLHEKILRSIGVHEVIRPEEDMGVRLAKHLVAENFFDWIDLSEDFSMVEMEMPDSWSGKTLQGMHVREKFRLNIVGIRQNGQLSINPDPDEPLPAGCKLIVVGANSDLATLKK